MGAEGDEIRQVRRAQGFTQKTLAAASGVGERTITRIETGEAERDGKDADSRSIVVLQRFLRCGPFKPESGHSDDPPLSQATPAELLRAISGTHVTFAELLDALANKHGQEVRAAVQVALNGVQTTRPAGSRPIRDRTGSSGLVMPRYDGSMYGSEQEAERANRPEETG